MSLGDWVQYRPYSNNTTTTWTHVVPPVKTKKQRIAELEAQVAALQGRVIALEGTPQRFVTPGWLTKFTYTANGTAN